MSKISKNTGRILLWLWLLIVCLPVSVFALIRTPYIQQVIADKASAYFSEELHTTVRIGRIDFIFPIDITLYDVYIEDLHQSPMLAATEIVVAPDNLSLDFSEFDFNKVLLNEARIRMIHYANEKDINFSFLINYFSGTEKKQTTTETKTPAFAVGMLELRNCAFMFQDQRKDTSDSDFINFTNIEITELSLIAEGVTYANDIAKAGIRHLTFADRSGFKVSHLNSNITFAPDKLMADDLTLHTGKSQIRADLTMKYDSLACFSDFLHKVELDADFDRTKLCFNELARFVPSLDGMNSTVRINGRVRGTIDNLNSEKLDLGIGSASDLVCSVSLKGLPDINNTEIHFNIVHSDLYLTDLDAFTLPEGKSLGLAASAGNMNEASLTASFDGRLDDFKAKVNATTNTGFVKADVASHGAFPNPQYVGSVDVSNFNLRPFIGDSVPVGELTATIDFSGRGASKKNYFIEGKADIVSMEYNNYRYSEIQVTGKTEPGTFEGRLIANDPNVALDFDGMIDFSESKPVYDFIARVENLNLTALNFSRNDSLSGLSGIIDMNVSGSNIDNMLGKLNLKDFTYYEGDKEIALNSLSLKLEEKDSLNKRIELKSDLVNGTIDGHFVFSEIDQAFRQYLSNYIPSFYAADSTAKKAADQTFSFDFALKDVQPVLNIFAPGIEVSKSSIARGNFNLAENYFRAEIASNYLKSGKIKVVNPMVMAETFNYNIYLTAQCDNMTYNDSLEIGNLVANTVTLKDNTSFSLNWTNQKSKKAYSGDISGNLVFAKGKPLTVGFDDSDMMINDSLIHIARDGRIDIDTTGIRIRNFTMLTGVQKLVMDGRISKDPYDVVQVSFENVLLDDFDDLTRSAKVNLDGKLNGYVLLSNLYDVPDYRADIDITKLMFNDNLVGDMKINSSWDDTRQAVYSEAMVFYKGNIGQNVPLDIKGYFNPRDKENMFDMVLTLDRFNLSLVQPYLKSFCSYVDGKCNGVVSIKGNPDKPDISGNISFLRTNMKVDYLNMYYSFASNLKITNNEFSMRGVTVFDSNGKAAKGDVVATHDHLKNVKLDITLNPEKMQFLNTTAKDNDYFYGSAFATGVVKIYGPLNQVAIEVVAKTEPGTVLYIPITSSTEVYENDFITFTSNKADSGRVQKDVKVKDSGVSLLFDVDVSPNAEVQIVFDPKIGDVMKGRGTGHIRMTLDRQGEMQMFGNLEIEEGDYLFTLENLFNKQFVVDPGGTLTWNGDPYGGKMDLTARYSVNTALYDLVYRNVDESESEQYKKKVPVSCLMHLTGDLLTPDIKFDLDLPESDENTKNLVNTVIPNEEEMNRQVFSLLVLKSFIPTETNNFNSSLSQGLGNSSMELLSSQFSNMLSQISRDFDVDFNYNQGDEVTSSQVEIAFSTQIKDRIVIETNLEIGGNQLGSTGQQASSIAGDVSIEYKISKDGKFRVKAFNRSNTVDVVANNAPYTQGMAVFYRKDFDRLRELWERKKEKMIVP